MSEDEDIAYSKSFIRSMHKNNLEKDLNNDLQNKILNEDQLNYHIEAAKSMNDIVLIKLLEAKAKRLNEQPKMTYQAPINGPPAIRRGRRSASRSRRQASRSRRSASRSRSPVRRQQHSGPVPRLNLSSSPSLSSGGKTFKRKHKHKHTKRR